MKRSLTGCLAPGGDEGIVRDESGGSPFRWGPAEESLAGVWITLMFPVGGSQRAGTRAGARQGDVVEGEGHVKAGRWSGARRYVSLKQKAADRPKVSKWHEKQYDERSRTLRKRSTVGDVYQVPTWSDDPEASGKVDVTWTSGADVVFKG
ncbi:hypothetical protein BHE74_00002874 [Ensete ventricosum]|nr:hypothetical protein BHE74_00002874 [Ensete ventricosum]RZR76010.1 hypothetical protein BHM03_00000614 [Ensete ventricosum]